LLRSERDSIAERIGELNAELSKFPKLCHELVELNFRYEILTQAINQPVEEENESTP
jgi:uncharacterized protein involved in exopolysaccharide biosynthesis